MYKPQKYSLVFIQGFNQRENRIYRKFSDLYEYIAIDGLQWRSEDVVNFPIGDFLECDYIYGPLDIIPDYVIVGPGVIARYFVTKITHVSGSQYSYHLVRDVLADYDSWLSDPAIIHRASEIPVSYDFAKYKKDMQLSQVKTSETLLKDRPDGRGWIVGYLTKNLITANSSVKVTKTPTAYSSVVDDVSSLEGKTYAYTSGEYYAIAVYFNNGLIDKHYVFAELGGIDPYFSWSEISGQSVIVGQYAWFLFKNSAIQFKNSSESKVETRMEAQMRNLRSAILSNHVFNAYNEMTDEVRALSDGGIIYDRASQKTYRVKVKHGYEKIQAGFTEAEMESLNNAFTDKAHKASPYSSLNYYIIWVFTETFSFEEFTEDKIVRVDLPANHTQTTDSAFDVFAIPLGGTITINKVDTTGATVSTEDIAIDDSYCMDIVNGIIHNYKYSTEATGLIDIQWLPYGPDQIVIPANAEMENYIRVAGTTTKVGILYWLPSCQLEKTLTDYTISVPTDALTARIEQETHAYRLCSPNQASMFDFSAVNNNGVTGYNIDIAFKPFTPYICVAPIFAGLYGSNFDDGRGLILSGDFSLDQSTNEWVSYKYANKNYELIFNRQIASMDISNSYAIQQANQEKTTDILNIFGSTAKGAGAGAFVGAKTGTPYGAVAGAVIGGATSLTDSIVQTVFNRQNMATESQLRTFARNEAIRQYQYQLGNIQARADTVTKISAFNPNFKIYPILEEYSCTAQEQSILTNGIKWNGLSLEQFGRIEDFTQDGTFIQATLLRDTAVPQQIFEAINNELEQGVYLYGDTSLSGDEEEEST